MTNDRNLQLAASLSILFLADLTHSMPNVDDGRQAGRLRLSLKRAEFEDKGPFKCYVTQIGGGGGGGVNFSRKKHYEGVRFNVISVTKGWVGV